MKRLMLITTMAACILTAAPRQGRCSDLMLRFGSEEIVQAGAADIDVPGYSVPSFADWDNDGLNDLIVGEGSGTYTGKIRIYINAGTESEPQFNTYFYAQYSNGADLTCTGSGCLGCFPRVVYWDEDTKKDLLVGQADGTLKIFLNLGSDNDPNFDAGTLLQVGPTGSKTTIDVGSRATPCVVDWDNDGKKDLAVGALDSKIYLFINKGTDTEPDFLAQSYALEYSSPLNVLSGRSSPDILDLDDDGKKDILTGNTNGQLLFYTNICTDSEPCFDVNEPVTTNGSPIDLASSRSRPFVCDWTEDGYPDVMIGASDGKIHLYQSVPQPGDMDKDYDVDLHDFAIFAFQWGETDCGNCGGADFFDDDEIDMLDVLTLATYWLEGIE